MAKLYFRYGAMNSGKTTLLLQTAHNYEENDMKAIIVKPAIDTKGEEKVVSRIGVERPVDLLLKEEDNLYEIVEEKYPDVACVLVDEAQFLTPKQIEEAFAIAVHRDVPVICYGLRTDFLTNGFPGSTRLLQLAHSLEEMKTICRCGNKAIFNARFVGDSFTLEGNQVAIDGEEVRYVPMCGKCYDTEKEKVLVKKKPFPSYYPKSK